MASGACIVNDGRKVMLNRAYKSTPDYSAISKFAVGTGTTTPSVSDTALNSEITALGKMDFNSGYPVFDENTQQVITQGFLSSVQGNGYTITEVGEFNSDATPKMFSRAVFTGINKNNTTEIIFQFTHKLKATE